MQRVTQLRKQIPDNWLAPWIVLLQTLFLPHKAFHQIREKGYLWLGPLVYLCSAMLGLYTIYTSSNLNQLSPWLIFFHPAQAIVQYILVNDYDIASLSWHHYGLCLITDIIAISTVLYTIGGYYHG